MRLYLVQHGDALPKDVDPERPLSDTGRADVSRLATWLAANGVSVHQIRHSGTLRARQTAELLRPVLGTGGSLQAVEGLAPNDEPAALLDGLRGVDENTLIAGHLPFLARAVSRAIGGTADLPLVEFRPGSVAVIERRSDTWILVGFVRPDLI